MYTISRDEKQLAKPTAFAVALGQYQGPYTGHPVSTCTACKK